MAGKAPRSKTTRSRPARPANKRYPETRMERGVLLAVGAVLGVAAIVVLAGLYVTEYRPPRAHAVTINGQSYNADAVKRRGSYLLRYEAEAAQDITQDVLVERTVDRMVRDEVLNTRAAALVGEVTDADVDQDYRVQLGFATPTATATPTRSASATATPAPTPAATATPTEVITPDAAQLRRQEADFATAVTALYKSAGLHRDEFYRIARAQIYETRLRNKFSTDVGKTAPQIKLEVIRVNDQATAQKLRDQAVAGADFVRLAAQNSVLPTAKQDGGELGWKLVATLEDNVRSAVETLPKNGISAIIPVDRFFEVYRVVEAKTDRDLDSTQADTLVQEKLDAWFEQETPNVQVERDISDGENKWIRDAIISDARGRGPVTTPTATGTATPRG
ncbi:MAG: peptidylprolyl isomerase [Dehalococcoidia bacterium]|nr:peptidylprolyl isomerase [Dehalococcoidia bacterium]